MTVLLHTTAIGVFDNREKADVAIDALHRLGFTSEQIGIAIHDHAATPGARSRVDLSSRKVDVTVGAMTGALVLGMFAAAAVWYALVFIPIWLAIGVGAVVGAVGCGLLAAWASMDISPEEAAFLEHEIKAGHAIVTVWANGRMDEADRILRRCGAYHVSHSGQRPVAAA